MNAVLSLALGPGSIVFAHVFLPPQGDSIERFIDRWKEADLGTRDRASEQTLSRWRQWTETDLLLLEKAARAEDAEVASRASDVLDRLRVRLRLGDRLLKQIGGIAVLLQDPDADVRAESILALKSLDVAGRFVAEMIPLVADESERVRYLAQWGLGGRVKRDHASLIVPMLKNSNVDVRKNALDLLRLTDARDVVGSVVPLLRDPDGELRRDAARTLVRFQAYALAGDLVPLLADSDPRVRGEAAHALSRIGTREHAPSIASLLDDTEWYVRDEAVCALGWLHALECAEHTSGLLIDPHPSVRADAVWAIGKMGARRFAGACARLLQDGEGSVRRSAVLALGRLGARECAGQVAPLLKSPNEWTQRYAILTLARLASMDPTDRGTLEWSRAIQELERDPSKAVRVTAAVALIRLGHKDRKGQLEAITTVGSGVFHHSIGRYLLQALALVHERSEFEKLNREREVGRSVESIQDLEAVIGAAGLRLKLQGEITLGGRIPAGCRMTLYDLLEEAIDDENVGVVISDGEVCLMPTQEALRLWRARLERAK